MKNLLIITGVIFTFTLTVFAQVNDSFSGQWGYDSEHASFTMNLTQTTYKITGTHFFIFNNGNGMDGSDDIISIEASVLNKQANDSLIRLHKASSSTKFAVGTITSLYLEDLTADLLLKMVTPDSMVMIITNEPAGFQLPSTLSLKREKSN
ncbi:MAG: hypothetical protein ACRDDZ_11640 [Marinifilaceae bacterium]